jgi:hypothetical protein
VDIDRIAASTDVDELWPALRRAKEAGDTDLADALQARMRDLAGHNDDRVHPHRDPNATNPTVIVSPTSTMA